MAKEIRVRIIMRYNSTEGWRDASLDSVLAKGEIGLEYISGSALPKMKIGNGSSSWAALPYFETSLPENFTWGDLRGTTLQTTSTETENLHLVKPGYTDIANVLTINKNFDKIDAAHLLQSNEMKSLGERITALASFSGADETALSAEIVDARTRANGEETYSSLGEALRAIDTDLQTFKTNLDEIVGKAMPSQLILDTEGKLYLADSEGVPISDGILVKDTQLANEVAAIRTRFGTAGQYETASGATQAIDAELQDIRIRANGDTSSRAGDTVRAIDTELQSLKKELNDAIETRIPDGLSYVDNMLALTVGGEIIGDPIEVIGGGGGGGQAASYTVSLTNLLDSRVIAVSVGTQVVLRYSYTSIDNEGMNDGMGSGELTVNGIKVANINVPQGENELDITSYLGNGENTVVLKVINSEGSYKSLRYTVSILSLSVTSTFPEMGYYNVDTLAIQYTVNGEGTKKVYFILTNLATNVSQTLTTEIVSASGQSRQYTMTRPKETGTYDLQIYAESGEVKSNVISIGMIWYDDTSTEPFVLIHTDQTTATEGEALKIPYLVYHPSTETPKATFTILQNGEEYSSQTFTVGRTAATWNIQQFPVGTVEFRITCGLAEASITMEIEKADFDKEIIENGLLLEFNATGRQNTEDKPDKWAYGDIEATFKNVGWKSIDGWYIREGEDQTVLRLLPGSEMEIPFFPFKSNIVETGYTIEVELATQNVSDYDSIVISSYSGGRGFVIKSQSAEMRSTNTSISAQFREDDRVRLTFVVEQNTVNRLVYIYINSVCCGVKQYATIDNFAHPADAIKGLTIGAETCGIDVYFIRFYNLAFSATQQLNNYICDRPTLKERIEAANRNDVVNANADDVYQSITINSLKNTVPYIVMECPELPQYKGDKKKGMSMSYTDPFNPEKSFSAKNCTFNVQGTSSSVYPIKNFKISFDTAEEGIVYTQSGERVLEGFKFLGDDSLPSATLCLKANYASSEQANNTMLIDYYEETCPYRNPPQQLDYRVRWGVYGKPIVVFWRNTQTNELFYQGSYSMNDDKSNENVFGFKGTDISSIIPAENQYIESWEFSNNNTALCLFQDGDMTSPVYDAESKTDVPRWTKSFERRFPEQEDDYSLNDITALTRVVQWVASTNRNAATGNALDAPYIAEGITYTNDTAEYRLAKFKKEFEDYFVLDAMAFYYVYTEVFILMDSRAKNLFLTTFDGEHWMPSPYDFDSALGKLMPVKPLLLTSRVFLMLTENP